MFQQSSVTLGGLAPHHHSPLTSLLWLCSYKMECLFVIHIKDGSIEWKLKGWLVFNKEKGSWWKYFESDSLEYHWDELIFFFLNAQTQENLELYHSLDWHSVFPMSQCQIFQNISLEQKLTKTGGIPWTTPTNSQPHPPNIIHAIHITHSTTRNTCTCTQSNWSNILPKGRGRRNNQEGKLSQRVVQEVVNIVHPHYHEEG